MCERLKIQQPLRPVKKMSNDNRVGGLVVRKACSTSLQFFLVDCSLFVFALCIHLFFSSRFVLYMRHLASKG